MKFATLSTLLLTAFGSASAQLGVSFLTPAPDTHITAGQPFTATVGFPVTTSSLEVVALYFGAKNAKAGGIDDIGQTELKVVFQPQFSTLQNGRRIENVELSFPKDLINGLDMTYNLTVGECFTIGATRTPQIHTAQVPVFVSST